MLKMRYFLGARDKEIELEREREREREKSASKTASGFEIRGSIYL